MSDRQRFASLVASLRLPVICAPMFLVSNPALVAAACEAGIAGAFPTMNCRTVADLERWLDELDARLAEIRSRGITPAPWAANLVVHSTNRRLPEDLALIVKHRAPIVITALGGPRAVVDAVHGYGGFVLADVITPAFARKAIEAGADGLVLVCAGAGGHTGSLAAPAFIAEVREFFDGPIVLAGAIANGRAIHACEVLGADLVYVGTSFIATHESMAFDGHKQMLVTATSADLFATQAFTGATANYLLPSIIAAGIDPGTLQPKAAVDASDPQAESKPWKNVWSAGQAVGQVKAIEPVATIVRRLDDEYRAVRRRFASVV